MHFKENITIQGVELTVTGYYTADRGDRDTPAYYECEIEDIMVNDVNIYDLLSVSVIESIEDKLSQTLN